MKSTLMFLLTFSLFSCVGKQEEIVVERYHLFVKADSSDLEKFIVHRCTDECIDKGHFIG